MKKVNIKKINFKELSNKFQKFLLNHKLAAISTMLIVLLACITIFISYAYYKVVKTEEIITSQVGEIPDIDVRILVEDRNDDGSAIKGKYIEYPYVPDAGYEYDAKQSYCTNGSELKYDAASRSMLVNTEGPERCFAYFNSIANLDIILNVELQDVDENGEPKEGSYTKVNSTDIPLFGYTLGENSCTNGATLSYNVDEHRFIILSSGKTVCNVKMDATEADVNLKLHIQKSVGANNEDDYEEVKELPTNQYYVINPDLTACTGSAQASLENQEVVIKTTTKTFCRVYLDISNGPIAEAAKIDSNNLNVTASILGTPVKQWFYSIDGGENYEKLNDNLISDKADDVLVYGEDEAGNQTKLINVNKDNDYYYDGLFSPQKDVYEVNIVKNGYYYLQVWGASDDNNNLGGYSEGYIYLEENDKLYVNVGSMPNEDSKIKVNKDVDDNLIIMAGGNSDGYVFDENVKSTVIDKKYYLAGAYAFNEYDSFTSPYNTNEIGHKGNGFVKVTYVGEKIPNE